MNLSQQIYNQLPNPSEIEDMIGELEHLINPVHGIFSDFKSTHDYDKKTWKELIDQADKAGEMLAAHLDKFHAIMQLTDTISQSEQKS
tara:strand:+ start:739 stop:1002 length:264 start_codon:yes stop_codon:yes gene_type:complete